MCNLYAVTKSQQAIRDLTRAMTDRTGNLPPLPGADSDEAGRLFQVKSAMHSNLIAATLPN